MKADLHTHSNYSDGTDTPTELVRGAKRAGLDLIALTDHDTVAGWPEAMVAAKTEALGLIRGLELSASYGRRPVHMLLYLPDPDHPRLRAELEKIRNSREIRIATMLDLLQQDFTLDVDEIRAGLSPGATLGRPHLADALVAAGVVANRSAAFEKYLHPRSKYFVRHYSIDVFDALQLGQEAGAVTVMAHPAAVSRGRTLPLEVISQLAEAGLDGLEIAHRDNPPHARLELQRIAERYELLVTGSSDYHGSGKPNQLGENLTDNATVEAIISRGKVCVYLP